MTWKIGLHYFVIFTYLGTSSIGIVLAEGTAGKILIDENRIQIEGVSVNSKIEGDSEKPNISQSISVGSIINSTENGVNSIEIGTVNANNDATCEQLKNTGTHSNTTKIMGNTGDIRLDHYVSTAVCIKGSSNKIVILENAIVNKLYLDGSQNEIYITDAANIKSIDIVGKRNTLNLPKGHSILLKGLVDNKIVNVR